MKEFEDYFSVQVFLIVLRETIESAIIISVLLSFVHRNFLSTKKLATKRNIAGEEEETQALFVSEEQSEQVQQRDDEVEQQLVKDSADLNRLAQYLKLQIWVGGLLGLVSCLIIGAGILWVFYHLGSDLWTITEHYWEGTFSILASVIISVMGIKLLRINKMQAKWRVKLHNAINNSNYLKSKKSNLWSEKYFMFILPFITTLREGMEAIVFIGGIGINENTSFTAIINSVLTALVMGTMIGVLLYRLGNSLSLQWFLVSSSILLYLVAAGLLSKGVWNFELQRFINLCDGFDVSETGHGPGSYDIQTSVWHVNCCNGELQDDGAFWMLMTAILGWTNSATFGSVISYNLYWIAIIATFYLLIYEEKNGKLPFPESWQRGRMLKRATLRTLINEEPSEGNLRADEPRASMNSLTPLTVDL